MIFENSQSGKEEILKVDFMNDAMLIYAKRK